MVRITWHDAKDTETGWLHIKDIVSAPLAVCQEVGYMVVNNDDKNSYYEIMVFRQR